MSHDRLHSSLGHLGALPSGADPEHEAGGGVECAAALLRWCEGGTWTGEIEDATYDVETVRRQKRKEYVVADGLTSLSIALDGWPFTPITSWKSAAKPKRTTTATGVER